jgi:hypothetical protein
MAGLAPPLPPNRMGGSPASGSPGSVGVSARLTLSTRAVVQTKQPLRRKPSVYRPRVHHRGARQPKRPPASCAPKAPCPRVETMCCSARFLQAGLACDPSIPNVPPTTSGGGWLRLLQARSPPPRPPLDSFRHSSSTSRLHFPASLGSAVVTRFLATPDALTPTGRLFGPPSAMNTVPVPAGLPA